ncbi:unnamed protein product, partial [Chrysoparadoxa australica]
MTVQSEGDNDIYLQKFTPSGQLIWGKSFGGEQIDHINDIAVNPQGEIFITGFYANIMRFPGTNLPDLISNGLQDVYLIKIAANGTLVWAKTFGGTQRDEGVSIDFDAAGNIHLGGTFRDQVDFDPGVGNNQTTSAGEEDVFVLTLDQNGAYNNHHTISGVEKQNITELKAYADGSVVLGGQFFGATHFSPTLTHHSSNTNFGEVYLVKYNANDQIEW